MTTATETQFSEELQALLISKGIPTEMPEHTPEALEWLALEEAYEKADNIHNKIVFSSGMDYGKRDTHEEAEKALSARLEYLAERSKGVQEALALTGRMLHEMTTRDLRQKAFESEVVRYEWRDQLHEVIKEANADHAAKYGEPMARFEKALSEIAKAGIVVKKSRRNLWKIADGVPVLYAPDGWNSRPYIVFFNQLGLITDGELTAAGQRVISRFEMESLKVETVEDARIAVKVERSRASYSRPEIAELQEYLESRWY